MKTMRIAAVAAAALAIGIVTDALTQAIIPTNSAPNPYRTFERWGEMPEGRIWGATAGIGIDRDGSSIWVAERCGAQGFIPPSRCARARSSTATAPTSIRS